MANIVAYVITADSSPTDPIYIISDSNSHEGWLWFDSDDRKWYKFKNDAWVECGYPDELALDSASFSGDVTFNGDIKVGESEGASDEITIGEHTLTFSKGILINST